MILSQLSLVVNCVASCVLLSLCHFISNLKLITISVEMLQISTIVGAKTISVILIQTGAGIHEYFLLEFLPPPPWFWCWWWHGEWWWTQACHHCRRWLGSPTCHRCCCWQSVVAMMWCCRCCCCSTTGVSPSTLSCFSVTTWTGITLSYSYFSTTPGTSQWFQYFQKKYL